MLLSCVFCSFVEFVVNLVAAACLSPKDQVRKDIMAAPVRPLNSVPENQVIKLN